MTNPDPGGEVGVVKRVSFEKLTVVNSRKIASRTQYPFPVCSWCANVFAKRSNFTENPGGEVGEVKRVSLKNHRFIHF